MNKMMIIAACFGLCAVGCDEDGTKTLKLDELLGVEIAVPQGTRASDNATGIGVMLKGPDVSMTVGQAVRTDPVTVEDAKEKAATFSAKNLVEHDLSDGYILTYETEVDAGRLYWLVGRRQFVNASYTCGVRSPKKAHQESGLDICKSLKK